MHSSVSLWCHICHLVNSLSTEFRKWSSQRLWGKSSERLIVRGINPDDVTGEESGIWGTHFGKSFLSRIKADSYFQVLSNSYCQSLLKGTTYLFCSHLFSSRQSLDLVKIEQPWYLSWYDKRVDHLYELKSTEVMVLEEKHSLFVFIGDHFDNSFEFFSELSNTKISNGWQFDHLHLECQCSQ